MEHRTDGAVLLSTGTLYGIVKRLLSDGLIRRSAAGSDERRLAHQLTAFGRKVALAEAERLRDLVLAAQTKRLLTFPRFDRSSDPLIPRRRSMGSPRCRNASTGRRRRGASSCM